MGAVPIGPHSIIALRGKITKNEMVSLMHQEQAYVKTAYRDVIQFKYAECLQIG